jgi:hypothetical protein
MDSARLARIMVFSQGGSPAAILGVGADHALEENTKDQVAMDRASRWGDRRCCPLRCSATIALSLMVTLGATSVRAAVTGCSQGSNFGRFLVSDVTPDFDCYIGDKRYSNFKDFRNVKNSDIFEITQSDPESMTHQLKVIAGGSGYFTPIESYKITYDVSVWTGDNFIRSYSTGVGTDDVSATWIKQLKSIEPKEESITIFSPNKSSSPAYFEVPTKTATFISELTVNASDSGVNYWIDTLSQKAFAVDPVPAPLPLLGGGMAWKLSRQLRRRIRRRA